MCFQIASKFLLATKKMGEKKNKKNKQSNKCLQLRQHTTINVYHTGL